MLEFSQTLSTVHIHASLLHSSIDASLLSHLMKEDQMSKPRADLLNLCLPLRLFRWPLGLHRPARHRLFLSACS